MIDQKWRRLGVMGLFLALLTACGSTYNLSEGFSLSKEPLLGKMVWHDLMTDDPAAARRFYSGILGWTFIETERPNGGPYLLARSGTRFVAGMIEVADPQSGEEFSRWLGYLSVEDVDKAAAFTREQGGSVLLAPRQIGQVGRSAVVFDPQGALVGLLRSNRGDPDDSLPGTPGSIGWNELLAADAADATRFYATLTGLQGREVTRRKGLYHILSDTARDRLGIFDNPIDGTDPVWLTHFMVADLDDAVKKVPQLGGEIILPPSEELREGSMALVLDPAGAALVLSAAQ